MADFTSEFGISIENGFLPSEEPLQYLDKFPELELIVSDFSNSLKAGIWGDLVDKIPVFDFSEIEDKRELERLHLIYACFAHGFIWEHNVPRNFLPSSIVDPWFQVCQKLHRLPILTHSSIVLNNWKRINPEGKIDASNLATLIQFYGGLDESWFYLLTVEIEKKGAPLIGLCIELAKKNFDLSEKEANDSLKFIESTIRDMHNSLNAMYSKCDPLIFNTRVRKFLTSFKDVTYKSEKLGATTRSYFGGSAAQSSIIQLLDALLMVEVEDETSKDYLLRMRDYMPGEHANFLEYMEANPAFTKFQDLEAFKDTREALKAFRTSHLKLVNDYIIAFNKKDKGTGGTSPAVFLNKIIDSTTS